jgi:photosystem II stability/assembly factor-like uncharacterized protein
MARKHEARANKMKAATERRAPAGRRLLLVIGLIAMGAAPAPLAADAGRWSALGPYGGAVNVLAVDPAHAGVVYAATYGGGGIFKSVDGGATWAQINHGLPLDFQAQALAVDPLQPTTLYLGSIGGLGVYKSVDGGASWTPPGPGLEDARGMVFALATDPRHSGTVYAGTQPGVDKTIDGGATWAPAQSGIPGGSQISALAIDPSSPSTIYAGTGVGNTGIYKTTNGGVSWAAVGPIPLGSALAVDPSNSRTVYTGSSAGVYKSTDGGMTWRPARRGMGRLPVYALAIAPRNSRTLYAGTSAGIYKSRDGGASWAGASQGLVDPRILSLAVDPRTASTVYSSTSNQTVGVIGGVFKTVDGAASWSASYQGLGSLPAGPFAVNPASPATLYVSVAGVGLLMTVDSGATWSPAVGLTKGIAAIVQDPSTPSTLYATGSQCGGPPPVTGLCRSLDGGATWNPIATPVGPTAFAVDPSVSADLYLAGATGFWRSTDGGASWTAATGDIAKAALSGIATAPKQPGTLYAFGAIPNGPHFEPPPMPRLYESVDRGLTWTQIQGGLVNGGQPALFVTALAIDPATSVLYAVVGGIVERSVDGGVTWSLLYQPADPLHSDLRDLALAPGQPATLYLPHAGGLLASSDGGATWQTIDAPGLAGNVSQLVVDPQDPQHLLALAADVIESLTRSAPVPCAPAATALCLGGGRFKVEAAWATGQTSGAGQAVSLTQDTGYFWFFGASNLELIVKVLDGCGLNGNFWVFAGGLTDVQVSLRITDSQSGNTEIYTNPGGVPLPPMQDTGAFPTCP